jgi:hypothetical protein
VTEGGGERRHTNTRATLWDSEDELFDKRPRAAGPGIAAKEWLLTRASWREESDIHRGSLQAQSQLRRGNGNEPGVSAFCSLSICIRHLPESLVGGERTGGHGEGSGLK